MKEQTDWDDLSLFDQRKLENLIHHAEFLEGAVKELRARVDRLEQLIDPELIDEEKRN